MEIITSDKGNYKICLNGHMYTLKDKETTSLKWKCVKASSLQCNAILETDKNMCYPYLRLNHCHKADSDKVVKCMNEMKMLGKTSKSNPVEVLAQGVSKINNAVKSKMPDHDAVKISSRNHTAHLNTNGLPFTFEGKFNIYTTSITII